MDNPPAGYSFAKKLPILLPAIHVILFVTTAITDGKVASNGNPLFAVDLPLSLPLIATDRWSTILIVAMLATVWWFFIAQIGGHSAKGNVSRVGAAAGALLIFLTCLGDAALMFSELRCCIFREPNFSPLDVLIYALATALLSGGLVSAGYSAKAACASRKK